MGGRAARRLQVHGTVQGVGFRPFVYRLATSLGLDGTVCNAGGHVVIDAAGPPDALDALAMRVRSEAPPRARVVRVDVEPLTTKVGTGFVVDDSVATTTTSARDFPPDLATCDACVAELFDPQDRRYRYPFLNCTDCGPRATIIDDLPYDRASTSMHAFPLCEKCRAEYADPANRRFHAEPVACPACGPQLSWDARTRSADCEHETRDAALRAAVAAIRSGAIVAVKGIGGYQLVCDATDDGAVARLRARKARWAKPFAVMVRDVAAARRVAVVSTVEERALTSVARPIVLLAARDDGDLAASVRPGTAQLGLFLPYSPLHHLLLADAQRPLVVTSGNRSDEPIVVNDADARSRLTGIADGFLTHGREIRARYDDSVVRVVAGRTAAVRRARGFAPDPVALPVATTTPLLALGAELKHTFTLADADRALVGPHTGDLEDVETFEAFEHNLRHLSRLEAIEPRLVVHDLHPAYLSTQYAARWPADRRMAVQHHHAHVASVAAEHGVTTPFIGVAYDGLGMGDDGTLWGGEVLVADLMAYRRAARFSRAPLPGGAAAVKRPVRMALGYLLGAEQVADPVPLQVPEGLLRRLAPRELEVVRSMVRRGVNCPRASSAGRLFDAVACLLGLCDDARYEGQAAVALETAAAGSSRTVALPWRLAAVDGVHVFDAAWTLRALLDARDSGAAVADLAAAFHTTVAQVTAALCRTVSDESGLRTVCLSGGVFQNVRLTTEVVALLDADGFVVHLNEQVPANDGGISYGQAAVAAARTRTDVRAGGG